MDIPGATSVEVTMSPDEPNLQLVSVGDSLRCSVDEIHDGVDSQLNLGVQVEFVLDASNLPIVKCEKTMKRKYSIALLRPSFRALLKADQTNIKMNEHGMLMMQHMITSNEHTNHKVMRHISTMCPTSYCQVLTELDRIRALSRH